MVFQKESEEKDKELKLFNCKERIRVNGIEKVASA